MRETEFQVRTTTWALPDHTCAIEVDMCPAYCTNCLPTGCARCAVAVYLHRHGEYLGIGRPIGEINGIKEMEHRGCRLPVEFCRHVSVCPVIPKPE